MTVHRLPIDQAYWPWNGARRGTLARADWHLRDRWNSAAAKRFGRLLDRVRPDLVHGHVLTGFSAALWPEVKRRGIPLAHSLRDYALLCPRAALFRRGRPCVTRCIDCRALTQPTHAASQLVDAVAANSEYTLDAHRRAGRFAGVGGQRLFNIVPGPASAVRAAHDGPLRFGFLGRIEAEKGIGILLAALPRITRKAWRMRIGGSGRGDEVARYRALGDGRIEWLGQVDADDFYRSIDVLVVPSLWPEPLPRTLIEGVAHGCSIIAAASGGIPEVVGCAPRSELYPAGDANALAAAMRAAIDEPTRWRARIVAGDDLAAFSEGAVVAAHHRFAELGIPHVSHGSAGAERSGNRVLQTGTMPRPHR
ncbi:MAG: glycosyltransferase [Sphingomicrobium sp.]